MKSVNKIFISFIYFYIIFIFRFKDIFMNNVLTSFNEIVDCYDVFLFDIWGVVHNGYKAYPNVVETLTFLKQQKKTVCFLSNSPKMGSEIHKDLAKFGVTEDLYAFAYTAGDSFWQAFQVEYKHDRKKNWFILDDCHTVNIRQRLLDAGVNVVDDLSKAHHVAVASIEENDFKLHKYKDFILTCLQNDVTVYSMNADSHVVSQHGPLMRPAQLMYALNAIGVKTVQHGKPHIEMFNEVFKLLPGVLKKRIVMVGDSVVTDVCGAQSSGIDSLLVYRSYPPAETLFHYTEGKIDIDVAQKDLTEADLLRFVSGLAEGPTYYIPEVRV